MQVHILLDVNPKIAVFSSGLFVKDCWEEGVSEIIVGGLSGVRQDNSKQKRPNAMIHHFWSHNYLIKKIKEKAEEYGIKTVQVNEASTSSICL